MKLSEERFRVLVIRALWAILITVLRMANKMSPPVTCSDIELELRQVKDAE